METREYQELADYANILSQHFERERKKAELRKMKNEAQVASMDELIQERDRALEEVAEATKKIDKLVTALKFYASELNQIAPIYAPLGKPGADFTAPYRMDKGGIARLTLDEMGIKYDTK